MFGRRRWPIAAPLLALWLASPLRRLVAQPADRRRAPVRLDADSRSSSCGMLARRTWRFFETFVSAEDNWLPPDNFQEDPAPVVAHRTSPTNIGLALLPTWPRYDFGYCHAAPLLDAHGADAFGTHGTLERYRGHFYNWYDTRTLKPLPPRYVSTVDSGNLAGHLLTLQRGPAGTGRSQHRRRRAVCDGLRDTLAVLLRQSPRPAPKTVAGSRSPRRSSASRAIRRRRCVGTRDGVQRLAAMLPQDRRRVAGGIAMTKRGAVAAARCSAHCRDALDEIALLAPWRTLLALTGAAATRAARTSR